MTNLSGIFLVPPQVTASTRCQSAAGSNLLRREDEMACDGFCAGAFAGYSVKEPAVSRLPADAVPRYPPSMRFIWRVITWFLLLSMGFTVLYRFVPVPLTITMVVDKNGFTRDWTPLSRIDRDMVDAVIAAEDSKFCTHSGFDQEAIVDAMVRNAKGERLRGGSTISQQVAKNVFLWQGSGWDRWLRKGLETWFTVLIETVWTKRRIMEVYLNVAETGIGTYGAEAGAQRYFKKSAAHLSRIEAARMVAALPSPKTRAVNNPHGFTYRYGNTIAARIQVVRGEGLDACIYA